MVILFKLSMWIGYPVHLQHSKQGEQVMRTFDIKRGMSAAVLALGILSSPAGAALPTAALAAPVDQWAPHPASTVLYPVRFAVATAPKGNVIWSSEYQAQRRTCETRAVSMGYLRGELHLTSGTYPASLPTTATADCLGYRENMIPE